MRRFSALGFGAILAVVAAVGVADDDETPDDSLPRFIAVKFHADTSPACKEMDAKYLAKIRTEFADKDILFLTADVTSRGSRHQAKMLLNALGLDRVWQKYGKSSGKLVVLDVDDGEEVYSCGASEDAGKVRKTIEDLLKGGGEEGCEPMEDEEGFEDDK